MIYLFYGSDVIKARAKAFEWVAKARAREPNLVYVRLSREELTDTALEDVALSGGLFIRRLLVLLDDPFVVHTRHAHRNDEEESEIEGSFDETIERHLDALAASDNAIVILAPVLPAARAEKIIAKAKIEYKYDALVVPENKRGFNNSLVNALATKNKEKLWLEINRALRAGDAPEMIHGLLHWKTRDLMEKRSHIWKQEELRALSLTLISLLQNSRGGGQDLDLALEQFALSI